CRGDGGAQAGDRVPARAGRVAGDRVGRDHHRVVPDGDVVERRVVNGTAADAVERGIDEAQVVAGVLVGHGDQPGPERGGRAGTACGADLVPATAVADDQRHAGVAGRVGGPVRNAPAAPGARDTVPVGGPGERVAEAAA